MRVAQRSLANLQGLQEHLLAFGRIVRLELLVSEAIVDGDSERMVGAEVVAQIV